MIISLIAAVSENWVIGKNGNLPWHLPDDFSHFKATTLGHHIIMGRKTFESFGKPLPGRPHLVISRNPAYSPEGCLVFPDLDSAIQHARQSRENEAFIIGGGEVFRQALHLADRIYFTLVKGKFDGDAKFPRLNEAEWQELSRRDHEADPRHAYPFSIRILERKTARNL